MALTVGELVAFLRLDPGQFNEGMTKAGDKMRSAGDKMEATGKQLTTRVTLPLVGVGVTALKMGGDFEASMNKVRAISGATGDDFERMRQVAKDMGSSTKFSASESADALGFLAMAGFDVAESVEALPGVLQLATAAGMDLASTADIASNVLSGFGLEVDQLSRLNDVLAKTASSANVDVGMLGEAFKMVAPTASAAGMSLEETSAAIGILGDAGIQGTMAGTALNAAISRMIDPTGRAASTLKELGVETTNSSGDLRSLTDILADLEDGGADVADMIAIFGQEAGPKMQALLSAGSDALGGLTGELENAGGTAADQAAVMGEGLNGAIATLKSAFEGLMIAVAESGLIEWGADLITMLAGWLQSMSQTNPEMLRVGVIIAGVVAVIGPLLFVLGKMIKLFVSATRAVIKFVRGLITMIKWIGRSVMWLGRMAMAALRAGRRFLVASAQVVAGAARMAASMAATAVRVVAGWVLMGAQALASAARMAAAWLIAMGPIGFIIAMIIALVAMIIANWDTIVEVTRKVWDWVVDKIGAAWDWITGRVSKAWSMVKSSFQAAIAWVMNLIGGWVSWQREKIDQVLGFIRSIPDRARRGLARLKNALLAPFKAAFNAVASLWNRSLGRINFSVPDWVPGVGGKGWSFPSMPMLARGGNIRQAGMAIVGEAGPELVHLGAGATVTPLDRPGHHDPQTITVRLRGDGILRGLRETVQVHGGDTTIVLGGRS